MSGEASVGSIIGYLRLDRSDWDAELAAAGRKADDLARHNPNIRVGTNAPSAIAQLNAVALATRRLQDAQGAENVAAVKLEELRRRGNASAGQLSAAEERLARAHRATAAALVGLAAANDANDAATRKAAADNDAAMRKAAEGALRAKLATDATGDSAKKSTFQMHVLADAIALLGPAAVPVAAVATGAILGLLPAATTAILGLRGITQEYQSGALAGTQYQTDIKSLVNEFANLKQTAASGLLGGVDQAIQGSQPLFGALNQDIAVMSNQLGTIVAGAGPALLQILHALNPLFVTFGQLLSDGATKLENWATSSDGIQQFVAYVQAELPTVMTALGQLVEVAGRLLAALAPMGHVILSGIGTLASVLNSIPTNVLTVLASGAVSAYVAFRTYSGIQAILAAVNGALEKHAATAALTEARVQASLLAQQAAFAEEAAAVAATRQAEAEATAVAAQEIATTVEGTSSVLAESATSAAASAAEFAAAMRVEAEAAAASATTIRAEATVAAETVAAEGEVAAAGWSAMLGPIGALVVGGGLMAAMFMNSGQSAQQAQEEINGLTDAIKQDSGAVGDNTRAYVANSLEKSGALDAARNLGINLQTLTSAALGNAAAQQAVGAALDDAKAKFAAAGGAHLNLAAEAAVGTGANQKLTQSILTVQSAITGTTGALGQAKQAYVNQQAALGINTTAANAAAVAQAKLYGLTGTDGVNAYLAAQQAAEQNTKQSEQQTLQYQLENDAASLLAQTLDKLAGKSLGYAQAQNAFDSALTNMGDHITATGKKVHFTTTSIMNMSSASVALRGQLLNQVTSAEQTAEAYGKMRGSSEAGRQELIKLRQEIIDNAVAHGVDRQAVTNYIDSVLKIPKSVPPTKLQIDAAAAKAALEAYKRELIALTKQRYVINIDQVTHGGYANVGVVGSGTTVKARASGGPVDGPGAKGVDSQLLWAAPGEWVIRDAAVDALKARYGPGVMQLINSGRLPAATSSSSAPVVTSASAERPPVVIKVYPSPSMDERAIATAAVRQMQALGI